MWISLWNTLSQSLELQSHTGSLWLWKLKYVFDFFYFSYLDICDEIMIIVYLHAKFRTALGLCCIWKHELGYLCCIWKYELVYLCFIWKYELGYLCCIWKYELVCIFCIQKYEQTLTSFVHHRLTEYLASHLVIMMKFWRSALQHWAELTLIFPKTIGKSFVTSYCTGLL